jgi:outer membrane biosynthesis protein TonB
MKSIQPLIISLLLHLCLYLLALVTPSSPLKNPHPQAIEVVYQNEPKARTFVADPNETDLKKAVEDLKDKAERLSRFTRRFQQEQVARRSGETRNNMSQQPAEMQAPHRVRESARRELQKPIERDGYERPPLTGQPNVGRQARMGDSSLAEYIPDVREGGFTALNSDQFVHYTFYARVNEQIRNRWVMNIRDFLDRASGAEINRLARKTQLSEVEIVLDSTGKFVKAIFFNRAENPVLDQSAVRAFQLASPLNNPPSEMIEADGYIRLRYGFYVQFRPRYMASGSK